MNLNLIGVVTNIAKCWSVRTDWKLRILEGRESDALVGLVTLLVELSEIVQTAEKMEPRIAKALSSEVLIEGVSDAQSVDRGGSD